MLLFVVLIIVINAIVVAVVMVVVVVVVILVIFIDVIAFASLGCQPSDMKKIGVGRPKPKHEPNRDQQIAVFEQFQEVVNR